MDKFLIGASKSKPSGQSVASEPHKKAATDKTKHIPWVEKYRPKAIDEVSYQEEIVAVLRKCIPSTSSSSSFSSSSSCKDQLPNLLFYGPPGTGKTSTILAVARQLFPNKQVYAQRVLELNASDERGIAVIRQKIKSFTQIAVSAAPSSTSSHKMVTSSSFAGGGGGGGGEDEDEEMVTQQHQPVGDVRGGRSRLKLVILDEADCMTRPAQAALRRTMEAASGGTAGGGGNTRFCLICNHISRLIDPITSRCVKFRFKPLLTQMGVDKLRHISACEFGDVTGRQNITNAQLKHLLVRLVGGDLRRAITLLQSYSQLHHRDLKHKDQQEQKQQQQEQQEEMEEEESHKIMTQLDEVAGRIPRKHFAELGELWGATSAAASSTITSSGGGGGGSVALRVVHWAKRFSRTGHSTLQFLHQLLEALLEQDENETNGENEKQDKEKQDKKKMTQQPIKMRLSESGKAAVMLKIAESEKALLDGASEYLQLIDVAACLLEQIKQCVDEHQTD